jgi:hypothetical protein
MMGNPKASSVAPLTALESLGSRDPGPEQPLVQARDFHFAVTWVTLFANLSPIEATGPRPRVEIPSTSLALVPVVVGAPLVEQRADQDSRAASQITTWEMVVPKMIRTGQRTFQPAESAWPGGKKELV